MADQELMNGLQAKRKEIEVIDNEIYYLKLALFNLNAREKKILDKDIKISAEAAGSINKLRKKIEEHKKPAHDIDNRIISIERQLDIDPEKEIETLENEIASNEIALRKLRIEREKNLNDRRKLRETDEEITRLKEANEGILKSIKRLKAEARNRESEKQSLIEEREELNESKRRNEIERNEAEKELSGLNKEGENENENIRNEKARLERELKAKLSEKERASEIFTELTGRFFGQRNIEDVTAGMDDMLPILLFPVKLETKFRETPSGTRELLVRVYPDEIEIVTHEEELTQNEYDSGIAYWKAIFDSKDDEQQKRDAWLNLVNRFGAPRSAWIAIKTRPENFNEPDGIASAEELNFPVLENIKPSSWTRPPRTKIMPDRFVIITFKNNNIIHQIIGNQIPEPLITGPDPLDPDASLDTETDITDIKLGADFDWTVDFEKAVNVGMGFKIPLAEPFSSEGFDRIFALGLRWTSDETESKNKTEELFNDHHFSPEGLSLLKQGAATNNTDEESSSFSSEDTFSSLSYFIEAGEPLFTRKTSVLEISDGQILCDFLGIDFTPLRNIANSDNTDFAEAVAMNRALYPATLGYYLDTLMEPVFSDEEREGIRDYFVNNVTGRGPVSAFRVGDQPYGILPTSNFSKWKWKREDEGGSFIFLNKMNEILSNFYGRWKSFIPSLPHVGQSGNPSEILLNILGLNPGSVNFFQRTGYSVDYLKNLANFKAGGKDFGEIIKNWFAAFNMLALLESLGYQSRDAAGNLKKMPHLLELIYLHYHTRLDNKNIIDINPLSESRKIKSFTTEEDGPNYIDWLVQTKTVVDLEKQNFGEGIEAPSSLLYLMLRHSLLNQLHDTTGKFYANNNIELVRYKKPQDFYNITTNTEPTKWEIMKAKANLVMPQTADNKLTIGDFILSGSSFNSNEAALENLKEVKDALNILSKLPTAKLERCFVEHLDCLTYRLDAWITAMMTYRLKKNRNIVSNSDSTEPKKGIYIGTYGWLENIRPSQNRKVISETDLPEELRTNGGGQIFEDPANGGFTHAPSISHANAAASLRNAYLTHAGSDDRELMSVNLSSSRIRNGMSIIEGIRNGQSIELLLGYQFERGLHDRTSENPSLSLNQFIYDFRDRFPIRVQPIPQKGGDESEETIEVNYITNGLDLAQITAAFPYGITSLNSVTPEVRNSILEEIDRLKDSLDSVKDILVSESAYQLALGNFERAGAAIKSVSDMTAPAEIEVINSQRGNEISITNRIGIQFENGLDLNLPANNPWNVTPFSPRATTEPGINKWLGKVLGDPASIRCLVQDIDEANNIESPFTELKLSDLGIHPIDFIYMTGNELQAGATELEERISYFYRRSINIEDSLTVKIEFGQTDNAADKSVKSFGEIFPLVMYLKKLITDGRHLHSEDFHIFSKDPYLDPDNKKGYDVTELESRIKKIKDQMNDALQSLRNAFENYNNDPAILAFADALRESLVNVSLFNLPEAIPFSKSGNSDTIKDILITQSEAIILRLEKSITESGDLITLAEQPDKSIESKVQLLTSAAKILLGDVFNILPLFSYNNPVDVLNAYNDREAVLLNYAKNTLNVKIPVEEWIEGLVRVRSRVDLFENVRMLSRSFENGEISLDAIQLPYKANDTWLATEYPDTIGEILHNTISIVMNFPEGFDPALQQSGILIDDWTEEIPNTSEVTGVSINCNQPNAAPPQTILLAITPEEKGHWSWNDLVEILDDTLTRAKLRAVEPDMIDQTNLAILFPALVSEFSAHQTNISLDYALNISKVNEAVKLNFKAK